MLDKAQPESDSSNNEGKQRENNETAQELIERFRPQLLRAIDRQIGEYLRKRFDEEDILQSAFCSFFRGASEGRYQCDHSTAFFQLLLTIATNKVKRSARYHTRQCRDIRREAGVPADEIGASNDGWNKQLTHDTKEVVELVGEIVDQLPERDAEFFRRRYVESQTIGQISTDTGWSLSTIKRVLLETQKKLRNRIDPDLEI